MIPSSHTSNLTSKVMQDYSMAEIGAGIIMATLENFTTTYQIMVKEIVVIFYK